MSSCYSYSAENECLVWINFYSWKRSTIYKSIVNFTGPNLGLWALKPIYWHQILVKEMIVSIAGHQIRTGNSCSKDPNSVMTFKRDFKGSVRDGASGCVISPCTVFRLVGIKVKFQESSTFWFQPVWVLCVYGPQI